MLPPNKNCRKSPVLSKVWDSEWEKCPLVPYLFSWPAQFPITSCQPNATCTCCHPCSISHNHWFSTFFTSQNIALKSNHNTREEVSIFPVRHQYSRPPLRAPYLAWSLLSFLLLSLSYLLSPLSSSLIEAAGIMQMQWPRQTLHV